MPLSASSSPSRGSDASSSAAPNNSDPHALASDSEDPSFDLEHVQTSTPHKGTRRHLYTDEADEEDAMHASDTESLHLEEDDLERTGRGAGTPLSSQTAALTRRSLLRFAGDEDAALFASPSVSLQPGSGRLAHSLRRDVRSELYAPSPSTGSSTLADRDDEITRKGFLVHGEDDVTLRRTRLELSRHEQIVEETDEDQGTVLPPGGSDDGSSSSPRPLRRARVGDLASYVDARMSASTSTHRTPRRSPPSARYAPTTPSAPGAFPSSTRKSPSFRSPSSSLPAASASTPPTTSSHQIQDAFKRLITGPDGALAHSAERRAALAAAATGPSPARHEPPTPHPAGYYAFVPSTTLPLERGTTSRREKRHEQALHEEDDRLDTPSRAQVQPSKLDRALRHLAQAQHEARAVDSASEVDLDEYFRPGAMNGSLEDQAEGPAPDAHFAGRSAIDFAMARSFAHEQGESVGYAPQASADDEDVRPPRRRVPPALRASQSVRFASPPPRPRSPSTSPPRSPSPPPTSTLRRSTTPPLPPPSPPLPPLPPLLAPDSPEPARNISRASFTRRPSSSATRRSPPRASERLAPVPPLGIDPPLVSPVFDSPPRSRITRPGWDRPTSSTPPRGAHYAPPAPSGTPPNQSQLSLSRTAARSPAPSPAREGEPTIGRLLGSPVRQSSREQDEADRSAERTVQDLVSQLADAVEALTAARDAVSLAPAARLDERGLPLARANELRGELERRKKDSEKRRRELQEEMREIEARNGRESDRRAAILDQLAETYEIEQELGFKVDELKRSVEGMGQLVGDRVAHAVGQTLQLDTQRRSRRLFIAFCVQLAIFLLFLRFANSRALALYDSTYYDSFHPALFHLPSSYSPSSSSPSFLSLAAPSDPHLSLETLAAFAPYPPSTGAPAWAPLAALELVFKRLALLSQRLWAARGGTTSAAPTVSSYVVPS
ncbi:uncharacterized protein JCM10292_000419 [Rhodotorula paludigena]|uniref:uncharacterized protein n=1 Tax=Rhodotorula paludigena TaxID=86838 RepID=UPI00317AA01E